MNNPINPVFKSNPRLSIRNFNIFLVLLSPLISHGQMVLPGVGSTIQTNYLMATMHTKGAAFGFPGIKYPVNTTYLGDSPYTLFKQGTWLSARNNVGELMVAATRYAQQNDYNPNPFSANLAPDANWNKV